MQFKPGALVQVLCEPWARALGLVKFTDAEGVWLRLGNGVVVTVQEYELDAVEYMPRTGCPATFTEELKPGTHDFHDRDPFPPPSILGLDAGPPPDDRRAG